MPEKPSWGYRDNHPVVNVSWDDIMTPGGFCDWASNVSGFKLSLPTDSQCEYAARGSRDGLEYPWSNEFDRSKLWCSEREFGDVGTTGAVDRSNRSFCNAFRLTDMVGNVWQWSADYYNDSYRPVGKDPTDKQNSNERCMRGGSWLNCDPIDFLCASRLGNKPDFKSNNLGFRLAVVRKAS